MDALKPIHNEIYQHQPYVTQTSNYTKKYIIKISNKNYTRHMYIPARVRALEHSCIHDVIYWCQ